MENFYEVPSLDFLSGEGIERIENVIPEFDFNGFVDKIVNGETFFDPENIITTFMKIFANEIYSAIRILGVIIAFVMICAVLENVQTAFNKENNISSIMCMALIIGLASKIFAQSCTYAESVSADITNLMLMMTPLIVSFMAGSGFLTTGMISHPVMLVMCNVFAVVFETILIPAAVVYMTISLTDMLSEAVELGKLRELIKKFYNFLLGIIMTLFTGMLGISSFAGAGLDSVGAKGAKFALSNMVPFVGRSISDAMGAVVSASLVLKNAVGISGIVAIIGLCLIPVLKIAAVVICIRVSTAVCEPIASRRIIGVLSVIGDSLSMVNAAIISISVMMIIAIGIMLGVG